MSEWISVKEAMPPLDKTVLVCWDYDADIEPEKDFLICYEGCSLRDWANFGGCPPTHWMYLPEPPK